MKKTKDKCSEAAPEIKNQQIKNQPMLVPQNKNQSNALMNLESEKNYNFLIGSAGSGKTLLATTFAIKKFLMGTYKKIVITRPAVSVDEEHGFLPGPLEAKLQPWMLPILDIFSEFFTDEQMEHYFEEGLIEIAPLAYMRGRNLGPIILNEHSDTRGFVIIADELQNATEKQMKMILSRLSKNSKLIMTGDLTQHDRGMEHNGLKDILNRIDAHKGKELKHITVDYFNINDVVRSPEVREILSLYPEDDK